MIILIPATWDRDLRCVNLHEVCPSACSVLLALRGTTEALGFVQSKAITAARRCE